MFSEIVRLTSEQVAALLQSAVPSLTRKIVAVHLHHTWRPTKSQFKGRATIEAIRNFHVNTNGWDDIVGAKIRCVPAEEHLGPMSFNNMEAPVPQQPT